MIKQVMIVGWVITFVVYIFWELRNLGTECLMDGWGVGGLEGHDSKFGVRCIPGLKKDGFVGMSLHV